MTKMLLVFLIIAGLVLYNTTTSVTVSQVEAVAVQGVESDIPVHANRAIADFSGELFAQVRMQGEPNTVISPLSAYVALAMAANGADGGTAAAFESVLGLSASDAAKSAVMLSAKLRETGPGTSLHTANALWLDDAIAVKPTFVDVMHQTFRAEAFRTDLQDPGTIANVNGWVDRQTNGMIPSLLSQISPDAVLLLLNTLYMDARWQMEFDPNSTAKRPFTLVDGGQVETEFLFDGLETRSYIKTDEVEGVMLPYLDGKLGFLAIKPISGNLANMAIDGGSIREWLEAMEITQNVSVSMPKFTCASTIEFSDALKAMGLNEAFDFDRADFSKMGSSEKGNIAIGSVLQKVVMQVNEKGTQAAAATVVQMMAGSARNDNPIYLSFDSPYFYTVIDLESGLPLFMGVMENPAL